MTASARRSRRQSSVITWTATPGWRARWARKSARERTTSVDGSMAVTVAERGSSSSRLISPKKSPGSLKMERITSRPDSP